MVAVKKSQEAASGREGGTYEQQAESRTLRGRVGHYVVECPKRVE